MSTKRILLLALTPLAPHAQATWSNCTSAGGQCLSSGNVGIGTTSPIVTLDSEGNNYRLSNSSAEVEFTVPFAGAANEKADFYMTGSQWFWGTIDVDVTDTYAYQDAAGIVSKRFYLGLNPSDAGGIYLNKSRVTDEGGYTADNYAISDLTWDSANSRYKFTLVHRVSTQNPPRVRLTAYSENPGLILYFENFTMGAIYTTDSTVYARPQVTYLDPVSFQGGIGVTGGNVGIGTATPTQALVVASSSDTFTNIDATAGTGQAGLKIYAGYASTGTNRAARIDLYNAPASSTIPQWTMINDYNQNGTNDFSLVGNSSSHRLLTVLQSGNVGIGTTTPAYQLSVKNTIGAGEVVVTNTTGWSDYVFDRDYPLASLANTAAYIEANHHLPGVPSADEVEKNGINLAEMQSKLLAKIEELTLHMIEAEKRTDRLESENKQLREQIERLNN